MYHISKKNRYLRLLLWLILSPLFMHAQKGAESDISVRQVEYMVRKGDLISNIAERFHVPLQELLHLNKITNSKFVAYPGRILIIPVQVRAKVWDPSRDIATEGSQAVEDRGHVRDYEMVDDPDDYTRGEDFILIAEAREDSLEFEIISLHISAVDRKITILQHRVDSLKKNEFTFTFDESEKSVMLEKMKSARDRYYLEGPIGLRLDSLKTVKTKLIQRHLKLHTRITEYEDLVNNAEYNQHNFVLKKIPKDAMWGDKLKYQSKYVDGKLVQIKVQETNPDRDAHHEGHHSVVSLRSSPKRQSDTLTPAITISTPAKPNTQNNLPKKTEVTASSDKVTIASQLIKPLIDTAAIAINTILAEKAMAQNMVINLADTINRASSKLTLDPQKVATTVKAIPLDTQTAISLSDTLADDPELVSKYPMYDFAEIIQTVNEEIISAVSEKTLLLISTVSYKTAFIKTEPDHANISVKEGDSKPAGEVTEKPIKEVAKVAVKDIPQKTDRDSGSAYVSISSLDPYMLREEKNLYNDPAVGFPKDTTPAKGLKVQEIEIYDNKKQPKYLIPVDTTTKIKGDFYMIKARQELEKGDFKSGEKYLRKSLDINPTNATAWMLHADIYLSVGVPDQALKDYLISSEIDSTNPKVFYNMALVYSQQKDNKKSLKCFSKAIDINNKYVLAYMGRASLLLDENDTQGAIEDYNKVLNTNKYYSPAFKARGLAKMELKNFSEAIADFDEFLEIGEKDAFVIYERGIAKALSNNLLQGCLDLSTARDLGFKDAEKAIKRFCQ